MMQQREQNSESGFTLLELLLVIGISAVFLAGLAQITRSWVDTEVSDSAGQHLQRVGNVVQNYLESQWTLLPASVPDVIADGAMPGSPWAGLATALDREGLLTGGVLRSPAGSDLQIAFVILPGTPNIYRATIFSKTTILNKKALNAARQAGAIGGTISAFPSAGNAVGAFGQWSAPVASLTGGVVTFPVTAERGYLVAVISYSSETLCGSFLFRENNALCPNGTTMSADLNMNGNDINAAGEIDTRDLNVANRANLGDTTVSGPATFNGPATMAQGMTVNNGMNVAGDAQFAGNVTMTGGTLNVTDLNASSVAAPQINTNTLNANNLALNTNNGSLAVDGNMTVNGDLAVGNNGSGEIYAGTINTGGINVGDGEIVTGTMNVVNTMEISGNVTMPAGSVVAADRLVADRCVQVSDGSGNYKKYGTCPP
ncbi:MAG: hypothetical protein JWM96_164 [Alphaproteobacteria bacterium]|nr:hypothetical protein [Alphaproteobacteria bacterium]